MVSDVNSGLPSRASIPSVERLLRHSDAEKLIAAFGRFAVTEAIRNVLADFRSALGEKNRQDAESFVASMVDGNAEALLIHQVSDRLQEEAKPSIRPVFNLTGTVLHTNLGRAALPEEAIEAMALAARGASNLEYDLGSGQRGDRDSHIEAQLRRLTGAEAATVVNNNAAAVLLVLNTLALRKEVPASRGELIEIGGSFRIPDVMARAGCRLREVGTTNRTHAADYEAAIGPKTGLVMKIHQSNYVIEGFTASVSETELARLCHKRGIPFVVDLGSGTLVDFRAYGLAHEATPAESLAHGADVVTFSGDKLLGGPQAGIIVGRADLVAKIRRNPLKRALRVDKFTIAALSAVLRIYSNPERLAQQLPTLRILTRSVPAIRASAERALAPLSIALREVASVEVTTCDSTVGSGVLPMEKIPSAGLAISPLGAKKSSGALLKKIAAAFRSLPVPVIGRLQSNLFILDFRCLDDEPSFIQQLSELSVK